MDTKKEMEKDITELIKDKVSWNVFTWAMGIILVVIGWGFFSTNAVSADMTSMRTDIATMKSDISWIKEALKSEYRR